MQAKLSPTFHQHLLNTYYVPSPLCRIRNLAVNEKDNIPATQQEINKRIEPPCADSDMGNIKDK